MKKFVTGFIVGAIICSMLGAFAVSYIAEPVTFKVMVNGKEFVSESPALAINGSTYLPLKATGEALGVPVKWNSDLFQVEVGTSPTTQVSYSRNNPAPINTTQTYTIENKYSDDDYSANITIKEVIRGSEAYKIIKAANRYNDPADEGFEYVLIKVAVSIISVEGDGAVDASHMDYDFATFSSTNEEMPDESIVEPTPALEGKLYSGASAEGWVVRQVRKDDANPKLAYGLDYDGKGGIWFSLQ